jgi:hypothetical protein
VEAAGLLYGERATRLTQLSGTRIEGTFQIDQSALNDVIAIAMKGDTVPTVRVLEANRIEIRYGVIHARAQLPPALAAGPAPRVTVMLASTVIAWVLRATLREPFVEVHGRHVTIHLAAVPAFASFRTFWPHLKFVGFSTVPGVVRMQLGVAIDDGVTHG